MGSAAGGRYCRAMDVLSATHLFLELTMRLPYLPLTKRDYMLKDDRERWDRARLVQDLRFVEQNRNSCRGFSPIVNSAHLEALLAPNRTCAEMFEAARKIFAHRTWRRKDYQVGGFWKRGKLFLDLSDKAHMDPKVVEIAFSLDCDCIFSALEGTECGMRRTDYQHRGVWDRSKLRRHINVELQPIVDGSFHVVDSLQGEELFECSSDGSDVSELEERFEDDDEEDAWE